jgi:hypothetical protein
MKPVAWWRLEQPCLTTVLNIEGVHAPKLDLTVVDNSPTNRVIVVLSIGNIFICEWGAQVGKIKSVSPCSHCRAFY